MGILLAQGSGFGDGGELFGAPAWVAWSIAIVIALLVILRIANSLAEIMRGPPGSPKALRHEALNAARRGEHEKAGDLFRQAGHISDAAEQYKIAGYPNKAADALSSAGVFDAAAPLYERSQVWEPAAEAYKKAGNWKKAESCYLKAGKKLLAARMWEEAGQPAKAAQYFKESGRLDKAAELLEKVGKDSEAAELLQQSFFLAIAGLADKKSALGKEDMRKLEERIVALWKRAGQTDRALDFYTRAGLLSKAAELCLEIGKPEQAIDIFVKSGMEDRAAQIYDAQGQSLKASRLRGDTAFRRGEFFSAARHYEEAGEMRLAAQAYLELNEVPRAAAMYEKAGDLGQSAHLLAKSGDWTGAAEKFEAAGDLEGALRCYDTLKDAHKRAQVLVRAGRHLRAASELLKSGRWDEAISALQRVDPNSAEAASANGLMGAALLEKGMHKLALERLELSLASGQASAPGGLSKLECQYYRGRALEGLGELEKAVRAYETVVSVNADFKDALHRISELQEKLSQAGIAAARAPAYNADAAKTEVLAARPPASPAGGIVVIAPPTEVVPRRPNDPARPRSGAVEVAPAAARSADRAPLEPRGDTSPVPRLTVDPHTPAPGVTIQQGRYRILEEIGRGGMGVVYKCADTLLDRVVAYKVLSAQIRDFPAALENFLREAKSAARLHHPNIVTLFDFGESESGYYMTLEYVSGKNLRQFMRSQPDKETMRGVLVGICNGLSYAHSQNVIHRDIKPSNILISDLDHRAKILDFGLAKIIEDVSATASGVLGTPWYMSPEQVLGTVIDARSDLYSFGVTLFEVLSGELPFKGRDFGYHHVHTIPPSPRSVNAEAVSEDMDRIILKCMEKRPDDRWSSADEVAEALKKAAL
jgi:tetratricopeptide (TPR) repeat protein